MTLGFFKLDIETDYAEQRNLFEQSFPETIGLAPSTRAFYDWKFHSFPDTIPSYEYVAKLGKTKIVGYYAAIPFSYKIGDQILRCGMVCDVMTSPEMRGKGVFTSLGKYSLEQLSTAKVDFVLGYPIRPEVIPGHLKAGWKIAFKMPMFLFPIQIKSLFSMRGFSWASHFGFAIVFIWRLVFAILNLGKKNTTTHIVTIPDLLALNDFDNFIESWMLQTTNALVKSKSFLKWRLGAPGAEYNAICVKDNRNQLTQIAIVRNIPLKGVPSLCILDWMTLKKNRRFSYACFSAMIAFAKSNASEVIVSMMSQTQARKLCIYWLGFIPTPAIFSVIIKNLQNSLQSANLFEEKNWSLMWIDSDDL